MAAGCAGPSPAASSRDKVYAPEDMPDICQDIDFNQSGNDIKELCGVQTRNYRAYKNIPEHRNLLLPKGGKIVLKGKALELRLQSTLPMPLPRELEGKFRFDEKFRRVFIKSRMDYCEFFPEDSEERVRLIKIDIPLDVGGEASVCYTVETGPATVQRKVGYAGRLEVLDCGEFRKLKTLSLKVQTDAVPPETPVSEEPVPEKPQP